MDRQFFVYIPASRSMALVDLKPVIPGRRVAEQSGEPGTITPGLRAMTFEGLSRGAAELNDLQEAFRRHHALQCGFCTVGILMSATQFLFEHAQPTEHEVREMLSGHICRCTGYHGIVEAILDTARRRAASEGRNTQGRAG